MSSKIPKLPSLLKSKIYKTGQTRGADDDLIYQNRVNRNNTVLIPYSEYQKCKSAPSNKGVYEKGFIVLLTPEEYFETKNINSVLAKDGLAVGKNALIFYYSRDQWSKYNPTSNKLSPATSRTAPLGGHYVARVPATTSSGDKKIRLGFSSSKLKGAGIRVYEYADSKTIAKCRIQLEYLFWHCKDSLDVAVKHGMTRKNALIRKAHIVSQAKTTNLDDLKKLKDARIINNSNVTICPLCLEEISASGFFSKVAQAQGRQVSDLTVTQLNLFHIAELRSGEFNHRPYNLGWGHHHCNTVVKDAGIEETLHWMSEVIERNRKNGFDFTKKA